MSVPLSFDETILDNTSSIKEEEIHSILEIFVSSDKLSNARLLLGLVRNERLEKLISL